MTLPPVIRIFFAVDLPADIKEQIGQFIGVLKKKARSHSIRWSRPENLHVTLQFLAEVKTEHLSQVIACVRNQLAVSLKHANLHFGSLQLFPNPFRPRVIVYEINPQDDLARLSGLIGEGIKLANYAIETRPFRAHLTLGRIKQPQGLDLHFLSEVKLPSMTALRINEVVLFRSEPQPEGSHYSVVERIPLGENDLLNQASA